MSFKFTALSSPVEASVSDSPYSQGPKQELQKLENTLRDLISGSHKNWIPTFSDSESTLRTLDKIVTGLTGVVLGLSDPKILCPNPNFKVKTDRGVHGCLATWHALDRFATSEMEKHETKHAFMRGYKAGEVAYAADNKSAFATSTVMPGREYNEATYDIIESHVYQAALNAYKLEGPLNAQFVSYEIQGAKVLTGFQSLIQPKSPQACAVFDGYFSALTLQRMKHAIPTALRWERFQQIGNKESQVLMLSEKENVERANHIARPNVQVPPREWLTVVDKPKFLARLQTLKAAHVNSEAGKRAQDFVLNRLLWLTSLSVAEIQ